MTVAENATVWVNDCATRKNKVFFKNMIADRVKDFAHGLGTHSPV
jgi:hypothetical protein